MSKTIYIHTINGLPATFNGDQICYASFYGPGNRPAYSLKEIRQQQKATFKYREKKNFDCNMHDYDYVRYRIK